MSLFERIVVGVDGTDWGFESSDKRSYLGRERILSSTP